MSNPLTAVLSKDPNAKKDYMIDWSDWLAVGETISTSTWTCSPSTIIASSPTSSIVNGTAAKVWLESGTAGIVYTLTNRITTSANRTDDRSVQVRVEEL